MSYDPLRVRVADIRPVAPMIREFSLIAVDGTLPAFSPGSHVVVEMQGHDKQWRNAYSLLSDGNAHATYKIAVRLQEASRGGSVFMHQQVKVGDELNISPPANLFAPHWAAKKHLLLAGGVGITPFMSYLPELQRRQANFELHYMYRSGQTGAYATELRSQLNGQLRCYDSDQQQHCQVKDLLSQQPLGTHVYICGPESLIEAVCQAADTLGWPTSAVHYEEFAAPKPGAPFQVSIKSSGEEIAVGSEQSMLEALEAAGIDIPNLCRGGVCGQCVTGVCDGEIEHRDAFLSAAEKASQQTVMPCVSRALSKKITLDL